VRVHKIQTLQASLVFGNIGRLTSDDLKSVRRSLGKLILDL
jgi:hypothetical protein